MRLAALTEFRAMVYTPASAPALTTLRKRIDRGQLPGGRQDGGRYYVDLDEFDRVNGLRDGLEADKKKLEEDPLLQGLV